MTAHQSNASGKGGQVLWASFALCAIALLAYSNSFHAGFALDNGVLIQDARIHEATRQNIGLILDHTFWWPVAEVGLYRPLTSLSFLFNYAVLGNAEHPEGYHWINLILHVCNVQLAFAVAQRIVRRFWPAVFIAGLWAVHPVLTESVTNIVGRADLLAGMSVLGGFLIYLKSTESSGWRKAAWLGALLLTTMAGVSSKENAVALIGVIGLYELTWWKERGRIGDLAAGIAACLPPLAIFLYQRSVVLAASSPAGFPFVDNPVTGAGFWVGRLTALKVMADYLALILWPARLASDYSYAQIPLITGAPRDWAAWVAVCAVGSALVLLYRRQPPMFFFGLFAFGTFLPASNLLFPIGTIMAERLIYLPAYGLIACLVLALYGIGERTGLRGLAPAILLVATSGLAVRTWERNPDWHDNLTLGESAVRAAPRSFKAHLMLADALYDADPQHSLLDRAIEEAERSVTLLAPLPDNLTSWSPYRRLAGLYLVKGDSLRPAASEGSILVWQRAIRLLRRVIAIREAHPVPPPPAGGVVVQILFADDYRTLSDALLRVNDTAGAYDAAIHARDLNPGSAAAYRAIARALHEAGRDDDAVAALNEGELLTSDSSLVADIILIYQARSDAGCALMQGTYGPVPDPACPMVHKQICAGFAGAMQVLFRERQEDHAKLMMNQAVQNYGCAIEPLRKTAGTLQ